MAYKVIILYRLYMPSYFLGTFTEYPYCKSPRTLQVITNKYILKQANLRTEISLFFSFTALLPEDSSRNNLS